MKRLILIIVVVLGVSSNSKAQEANKFRFDIGLGYATPTNDGGGGILFNLEPKWTLNEKMNVGLRFGLAAYGRSGTDDSEVEVEVGANASYIGTYDYYFHNGSSSFAPFIGAGIGYYAVADVSVASTDFDSSGNQIGADGKFGGMLRAGFDLGKFRVAAEYNLIGKSDVLDLDNQVIGDAKNGYIGISLGAYFGGGKWKK